jgi:D-alanyl-D-alanine carboxypeptidase/D-alanyl-D-alanine-endopeptidase (penicillin-binding protein 4)
MMRLQLRLVSLLLLVLAGTLQATAQSVKPATAAELRRSIEQLIDHPRFSGARWGVLIRTSDGRVVYDRDSERTFIPASNMKLYTTAAALDQFGPGARVRTSLYASRSAGRNGVLSSDLILYGRGAPNLSPRFVDPSARKYSELTPAKTIPAIEELADRLKSLGIRVVSGHIIGDDSYFAGDLLGPGWEWDDAQYYYGAEVSALTVNDNSVTLLVSPGKRVGTPPAVEVLPATGYVKIVNNARTVSGGEPRIGARRGLNSNTIEIFGVIPVRATPRQIDVAVHNPALFAATLLREALARRRIIVRGSTRQMDAVARLAAPFNEAGLVELAGLDSEPVSEMIKVVNKESQNLHAELLLRQLGRAALNTDATLPRLDDLGRPVPVINAGNNLRRQFLEKAGIDLRPLSLRDGSGLARQNLVTPAATARLLEFMASHPYRNFYEESLVIAGVDGTMERRMRETAVTNNLRGKTGTLTYANALSGYLTTRGGSRLIISLMGNNHVGPSREVTSTMDQICILLAEYEGEF